MVGAKSGGDVGRVLLHGVEGVRRELDEHITAMQNVDRQVTDMVARRGAALLDLAKAYLPDISAETIRGTFVEVRDDLAAILVQKNRRQREVQDKLGGVQRDLEHQEAELQRITSELDAKVAERERLEKLVAERLHGSEEFKTLSQQALEAEEQLEKNEARVAEVQGDAKEKLPSYDRSKLFRYLYDAGYGTAKYQAKGWTKAIDDWVAKLIDFNTARRGYDFLRVTPELMEAEVKRRRDAFNGLMAQVEAIEDKVGDEVGLTAVMREGQELGSQRDTLVAGVAASQDELRRQQQELLRLSGTQNEFYEQAVARMKNFLAGVPPQELLEHSRETPQREDDAIVAEVSYLGKQLEDAKRQGAAMVHDRQAWDERLGGLQQVLQQFRRAEFDSQRSLFPGDFDVESLVRQYLDGKLSAQQLWSAIHDQQEFAPAWHEQAPYGVPQGRGPQGGGPTLGDIITSDASIALLRVLTTVAGEAMRHAAYRGVERRAPERQQQREAAGRPPFPNRGFTNGRGF